MTSGSVLAMAALGGAVWAAGVLTGWAYAVARHHYLSTACHHGLHVRCRKVCKFCDRTCRCHCHTAGEDTPQGPPRIPPSP